MWGAWDVAGGGWVARFRNYLESNYDSYMAVYNLGVSGDTTTDLLKRFSTEVVARDPDLIVFGIGINDSEYVNTKSNPRVPLVDFEKNIKKLITLAGEVTDNIAFVGLTDVDDSKTSPVSWNHSHYYDTENILVYNEKIKQICDQAKLPFVDLLGLIKPADLEDGLHPNTNGHKKIFIKVKDFLEANNFF